MSSIAIDRDAVRFGDRFTLRFERTLRVPDDGRRYPLPPGLGRFRVHSVDDYRDRVPAHWRDSGGVFMAMYQSEALWLSFDAAPWKPSAVMVAVGRINALTGGPSPGPLQASPQNYLVCPPQLWLDGINAGDSFVRQFVAMPLGRGMTVEGQITGVELHGGLQVSVFDPRPGRFPDTPPRGAERRRAPPSMAAADEAPAMGFAPGGQIDQKLLVDPYGVDIWLPDPVGTLTVHVLNSAQYAAVTGHAPPEPPVSASTYAEHGFPWFQLYDEGPGIPASEALAQLASLATFDPTAAGKARIRPSIIRTIGRSRRGRRTPNKR
jgi:hypothetical protein